MANKILRTVLKILIVVFAYLLQIYVVNNTTFFGVNGDLCLMTVVLITLMEKNHIAYITAVICGVLSDVLFSSVVCKYLVIYVIVVSVLIGLKKMYKQDSKLSIIVFSVAGIVVSEILMLLFNLVSTGEFINVFTFILNINVFTFIFNIVKQCIINICLAFVMYLAFRISGKEGE